MEEAIRYGVEICGQQKCVEIKNKRAAADVALLRTIGMNELSAFQFLSFFSLQKHSNCTIFLKSSFSKANDQKPRVRGL